MSKWTSVDRLDDYDAVVSDDTEQAFVLDISVRDTSFFRCMVWDTADSWRAGVLALNGWWVSTSNYRVRGDAQREVEQFVEALPSVLGSPAGAKPSITHDRAPNDAIHRILDVLEKVVGTL